MSDPNGKQVTVIGAGLGGISAALSLRARGFEVDIYEKNDKIGGKLNVLKQEGYSFDLGPSIMTLPHYFEPLFTMHGRRLQDYISLVPLRPHWRNHFEDGRVVDLHPETDRMNAELDKLGTPGLRAAFARFMEYSGRQYDLAARGYFAGLDTLGEMIRHYGLWTTFTRFDFLRTMDQGVRRYIRDPYLIDILDFFIKYVGSSAYHAPGFMNLMPTIQYRYDLWYAEGGMYNIALGLKRLLEETGVRVHLNSEVTAILREDRRVTGIRTGEGDVPADVVVSNMEVIPAYESLLDESPSFLKSLKKFAPACSGLVIDLGLDCRYEQLAHHNFFFSSNQRQHFHSVFQEKKLPHDPTIYLVCASRTDPTVAPDGRDCLKILPHIPPINDTHPYTHEDYLGLKERILDKLERMGLTDLRRHVVFEHLWTPHDIQKMYYSNRGSIYGVVSDRGKNLAFKAPKRSRKYDNLFFVGGSVNPGGGMPMVVLSGQNAADRIANEYG